MTIPLFNCATSISKKYEFLFLFENDNISVVLFVRCHDDHYLEKQCHQHTLTSKYIQWLCDDKTLNDQPWIDSYEIVCELY